MKRTAVMMLMMTVVPTVVVADDTMKVVAAPQEFIGQQVTVSCELAYAQEESPTWCEVYNSSGHGVGTIYIYLNTMPRQEDRLRAMQECADQNPRKNNRDRCVVTLSGRVAAQRQSAYLNDPTLAWTNK